MSAWPSWKSASAASSLSVASSAALPNHAAASTSLFDDFLAREAARSRRPLEPFDGGDYVLDLCDAGGD